MGVAVPVGGFEEFFEAQHLRLSRALYLLTGSASEADELAQEALVRVYERGTEWGKASPEGYLFRTALNLHRSRLRSSPGGRASGSSRSRRPTPPTSWGPGQHRPRPREAPRRAAQRRGARRVARDGAGGGSQGPADQAGILSSPPVPGQGRAPELGRPMPELHDCSSGEPRATRPRRPARAGARTGRRRAANRRVGTAVVALVVVAATAGVCRVCSPPPTPWCWSRHRTLGRHLGRRPTGGSAQSHGDPRAAGTTAGLHERSWSTTPRRCAGHPLHDDRDRRARRRRTGDRGAGRHVRRRQRAGRRIPSAEQLRDYTVVRDAVTNTLADNSA